MAPTLSPSVGRKFIPNTINLSKSLVEGLERKVGEPITLGSILNDHVLQLFLENHLQLKVNEEQRKRWSDAYRKVMTWNMQRIYKPYLWLPLGYWLHKILFWVDDGEKTLLELCRNLVVSRIEERSKCKEDNKTPRQLPFLDHLIDVYLLDPIRISPKDHVEALTEEVLLDVLGYHTSTTAIHSILFDLAKNQSAQNKLFHELSSIDMADGSIVTRQLEILPFLDQCIKESLRLRPPVTNLSWVSPCEIMFNGHSIPQNTSIISSLYFVSPLTKRKS